MQVHFFVLQALPEAFGEDIIQGSAFAVHANLHLRGQEDNRVLGASEVTALVMIPNRGNGDSERPPRGRQHKRQFQGFREFPCHDAPRIPIDNGDQVQPPWTSRMYVTSMPQT